MTKFLLATVAFALAVPASAATFVQSATNPLTGGIAGGARLRAFDLTPPASGQRELFVGRHDLGVAANRAEIDAVYTTNINQFTLAYDAGTDVLTATLNGASRSFNDWAGGLGATFAGKPLNRLTLEVRDSSANGAITINSASVNGLGYNGFGTSDGFSYFTENGNFRNSFLVNVNFTLAGTFTGGAEGDRIQVLFGSVVPEPATWAMMIGGFGFVGAAMRRRNAVRVALA